MKSRERGGQMKPWGREGSGDVIDGGGQMTSVCRGGSGEVSGWSGVR